MVERYASIPTDRVSTRALPSLRRSSANGDASTQGDVSDASDVRNDAGGEQRSPTRFPATGSGAHARRWLSAMALLALACEGDAALRWSDPLRIEIRGGDYQWTVRYPGADGRLLTADDISAKQDLHVPLGTVIQIELESDDFIYSFRLPDFGVNQMAVPELTFKAEFYPTAAGSYPLLGDQMCGYSHPDLLGRVVVHEPDAFREWLARQIQEALDG